MPSLKILKSLRKKQRVLIGIILFMALLIFLLGVIPVGPGNWNSNQIQRISTEPTSSKFCFAVMGDNKNSFATFRQIIEDVNLKKPLFAIDVGDLVYDGEKEKYRIFYNEIQKSTVPFLVAIGNHDVTEGGRDNFFRIFGDFYYSFAFNDSLFIVLDDANEKSIDLQQMDYLEQELKRGFRHKFVFMHVPPFDPRDYTLKLPLIHKRFELEHCLSDKQNAQQFMNLMTKYNVTLVFTSHIHGYFKEVRAGVTYVITGGAGSEMLFSDPEHYFYHYLNVCVNGAKVEYTIVRFPSPPSNPFSHWTHAAWLYIWYFIVTHRLRILVTFIIVYVLVDIRKVYRQKSKGK